MPSTPEVRAWMDSAWTMRRTALSASGGEQRELLERAKELLTRARAACADGDDRVLEAHATHLLANVELDLGERDTAHSLWSEAVRLLRAADDPLHLAHKVRHLGDLHRQCGRWAEAEACFAEALELYRAHAAPNALDFANAASRMADLKERTGEADEARALWRETRELYATAGVPQGVEEADRHLEELGDA